MLSKVVRHWRGIRIPLVLYEHPLGVFLVILLTLTGFTYAAGIAQPSRLVEKLDDGWLRVWGALLFASSLMLLISMMRRSIPLEKLALHLTSICMAVYGAWIGAVGGFNATVTVVLCALFVFFCGLRIRVLKKLIRDAPVPRDGGGE